MPVPPPIVGRQQLIDRVEKIIVRAGADLDDGDSAGGMRGEDVEQTFVTGLQEGTDLPSEVHDDRSGSRDDIDLDGSHGQVLSPRKISDTLESIRIA